MIFLVFWCKNCKIPVFDVETCPICDGTLKSITTSGMCNPVFKQEYKLLSYIWEIDLDNKSIWYLGSGRYLVDGVRKTLPFKEYYQNKKHLKIAQDLRDNIDNDASIPNEELFIQANLRYLNSKIYEAEEYILHTMEECSKDTLHNWIPTVSFSGGKDSTVISRIVRDALQSEDIIHYFGDTTLEFPITYEYVNRLFRCENPIPPIINSETDNDFFKLCNYFGPPSRYERWCCTIFKTSNLNGEYQCLNGNSLTFLGIRHSESKERQNYDRTQKKSKIGSQINAMPIIDWLDYDVWLYILYKKIAFNPAYTYGYKRVGCWCCPNNSEWSQMLTEIYYPELSNKWRSLLYDFAIKTHKTDIDDYIDAGKWKARRGASGLQAKNVPIQDTPCNISDRARNIIIKKKFQPDIIELLKPFGNLDITEKQDKTIILVSLNSENLFQIIVTYGTNVLKVVPLEIRDVNTLISRLKCQMRKYQFCIKCTACDSVCPYGAIDTMKGKYIIDENKCQHCYKCISKFYNGCITAQVLRGKHE